MPYLISQTFAGSDARMYFPDTLVPPSSVLVKVAAKYTSVGTGSRRVHVGMYNKDGQQMWANVGPRAQGANLSWWYYCAHGLPWDSAGSGQDENWIPWPDHYDIPSGGFLRVWDDAAVPQGVNDTITINAHIQ